MEHTKQTPTMKATGCIAGRLFIEVSNLKVEASSSFNLLIFKVYLAAFIYLLVCIKM